MLTCCYITFFNVVTLSCEKHTKTHAERIYKLQHIKHLYVLHVFVCFSQASSIQIYINETYKNPIKPYKTHKKHIKNIKKKELACENCEKCERNERANERNERTNERNVRK